MKKPYQIAVATVMILSETDVLRVSDFSSLDIGEWVPVD